MSQTQDQQNLNRDTENKVLQEAFNANSDYNAHIPVLIDDIIAYILHHNVNNDESKQTKHTPTTIYDGTFGGGGYTRALLQLDDLVKVSAVDADEDAVKKGKKLFSGEIQRGRLGLTHARFDIGLDNYADDYFDYIIADLGFSSNQLESSGRGFSYLQRDEVLDLRFDITSGTPCYQKIYSVKAVDNLRSIIYQYSGESHSKRIAELIYDLAQAKKYQDESLRVGEIVDAIVSIIPPKEKRHTNAILSRVWQALRIWTNDEFAVLETLLKKSVPKLKLNGCLMVVCFHSLEDKLVTKFMRTCAKPYEIDDYGNKAVDFNLITKKAIVPSDQEITENPRSRSATLRILQKLR